MGPSQATYGGKWAWFGGEKPLGFTFKTALDRYTIDTAFPSHAAFPCLSISLHTQTHASTQPSLRSEEAFSPLPSTEKSMQVAQAKLSRIVRGTAPPMLEKPSSLRCASHRMLNSQQFSTIFLRWNSRTSEPT